MHAAEARTDGLTGLANRRALDQELACQFEAFQRNGRKMALAMVNVNHFKRFNDIYGHQVGNRVLCGLAGNLLGQARSSDLVSRYGGEEFALVLPETSLETACDRAEQLRRAVETARYRDGGAELRVTISVGVAVLTDGDDPAGLIRRADAALYASKKHGRNRVSRHDGRQIHAWRPPKPPAQGEPQLVDAKSQPPQEPQPPAGETAGRDRDLCDWAALGRLLRRRLSECRQAGQPLSLVLLRVDGFSEILAAYGPQASLLATRITTQFLGASFHGMDAAGQLQPDTFAALLPGTRAAQAADHGGASAVGHRPLQVSPGRAVLRIHRERGRRRGQSPRRSRATAPAVGRDARRGRSRRRQLYIPPYGPVARAGRPPHYCCAS